MIFKKENYPETWPFLDGNVISIAIEQGSMVVEIEGKYYALNGKAIITKGLPKVNIILNKTVRPFIKMVKEGNNG